MLRFTLGQLYGGLLLCAMPLYGVGSTLSPNVSGVVLVFLNGVVVACAGYVGLLALAPGRRRKTGLLYLSGRVVEAVLLLVGALTPRLDTTLYLVAMTVLSAVSIPFCYALLRDAALPSWLALWGMLGYFVFAVGCVLQLCTGVAAALVAAAPGGLFELVTGIFLLFFGFQNGPTDGDDLPLLPTTSTERKRAVMR